MNYYTESKNEMDYLLQFYSEKQIDTYAQGSVSRLNDLYLKCQPKKVPIGSLKKQVHSKHIMVSSPDGFVPVLDCVEKIKLDMYKILFSTGEEIQSSHDHLYQRANGIWAYARELKVGDEILHNNGITLVREISSKSGKETKVYDLSVNHPNHRYYTNNVCSHNSGKSLFLQNLAVNWMLAGEHGVYLTLELSEELCAMRIDSMLSGLPSRDIFKNLDQIEMQVRMQGKKSGSLQIKYMPAQSTVNDIRSYLKELQIQTGRIIKYLCVDYLDLLMPVSARVSPSDLFVKDKYVSEELRNLAKELDIVLVTASQLNRGAVEEIEFDHSHISGGISKINTADNVFGIFTSRSMRESGRYQLQLMKTRSSSGVGQKVELLFDIDSLRITDAGEDENAHQTSLSKNSDIMNRIKNRTDTSVQSNDDKEPTKTIRADVQSTKLKEMLKALKQ